MCKQVDATRRANLIRKVGALMTLVALTFKRTNMFIFERNVCVFVCVCMYVRGGADKSLARPGRKQATAIKLGIYSTYSPRSSIHFLARYSNFCKPLKKKIRRLSVQPGLRDSNDLRVGRKMATFQLFFSPGKIGRAHV